MHKGLAPAFGVRLLAAAFATILLKLGEAKAAASNLRRTVINM
ncbi:MAG: hypothetical protein NTX50_19075 [Candidatus Sumerlaeota bacterium]|nr:hypothetical protein [Candidatus Sumerlaeota bacterium]